MDMVLLDVFLLLSLCHQSCKYFPYCPLLLYFNSTDTWYLRSDSAMLKCISLVNRKELFSLYQC